jgi:hypothetical protein
VGDNQDNIVFKLDLDSKQFVGGIVEAKKVLGELGEVESMESLLGVLKNLGLAAGVIAVAFYGLKGALDLTMEAESIKRTEEQFKMLTEQSGIATEKLKEGLEKSAKGLAGLDDVMKSSNKAIIAMGQSAERLPEVMELATKATRVFGGEVLSNFEQISQALAAGRTRSLKQFGITVDDSKAVKDFAAAHGVAANALSESGRRQAILNEALKQAKIRFKDIKADGDELTTTWQKMKVALKETYETFAMFFDKYFGDMVRKSVKTVTNAISELSTAARAAMGDSAAKHAIELKQYEQKKVELTKLKEIEIDLQKKHDMAVKNGTNMVADNYQQMLDGNKKRQAQLIANIDETNKKIEEQKREIDSKEDKKTSGSIESGLDKEQLEKNRTLFERDLAQMREERLKVQIDTNKDYENVDNLFKEQQKVLELQHQAQIEEIKQKPYLDSKQKKLEIEQEELLYNEQMRKHLEDQVRMKEDADKRMRDSHESSMKAMGAGVRAYAAEGTKNFDTVGKRSAMAMGIFMNQTTNALKEWGAGTKTASEAIRGMMLGMIADMAEASGRFMMLDAFKTYPVINYPELAAGAGLVALSGFLGGMAGGSSSVGAGGGGGSGGFSGGALSDNSQMGETLTEDTQKKKAVHVEIHGNYLETEQTRRQLLEMIRQETDATNFSYSSVRA